MQMEQLLSLGTRGRAQSRGSARLGLNSDCHCPSGMGGWRRTRVAGMEGEPVPAVGSLFSSIPLELCSAAWVLTKRPACLEWARARPAPSPWSWNSRGFSKTLLPLALQHCCHWHRSTAAVQEHCSTAAINTGALQQHRSTAALLPSAQEHCSTASISTGALQHYFTAFTAHL